MSGECKREQVGELLLRVEHEECEKDIENRFMYVYISN